VATVALFAPAAVAVAKRTAKTTAAETWTTGAEKAIGEGVLAASGIADDRRLGCLRGYM
jgi:hypothetical protein